MEIRYPDYYKKFHCIAGACLDTCCAGWEIAVDQRSEKRYRAAQKVLENREFARKLKTYVRNGRIVSDDVTCPFLNEDGLCEMYIELGPEALCHTCARHPRHLEDYGDLHELVLLLSCPEAARLILTENQSGFYVRSIPEKQGDMDGIDETLLDVLLRTRDCVWNIGKEAGADGHRSSLEHRMMAAAALVHDVQRRIRMEEYEAVDEVLERYCASGAVDRFAEQWSARTNSQYHGNYMERFLLMSDFMEELTGLDTVCRAWPEMLETCRTKLYHSNDSRRRYVEKREVFLLENHTKDIERIFHYFVYSFLLTSLYDRDALTKIKMAILCTMAIEELYMAAENLTLDTRINICHALARQIENSDDNRAKLEKFLKKETFRTRRIINALY